MSELLEQQQFEVFEQEPNYHIHIEPTQGWVSVQFRELWRYRELLYFLTWRDIKIRYKQTALGAVWAVIQPFMQMVVFSLFFGKLANMPSDGVPYPIFNYAGLLPWNYFSQAMMLSSNSLVGNANLITKVYFPRLIVPIASALSGLVDFAISFLMLFVIMFYYAVRPDSGYTIQVTSGLAFLPLFILLALVTALGVALWFSALNVKYRDVRFVIPFLTQFWLFATPVIYPSSLLEDPFWRTLFGLNPMAGVVEGFRWALLGSSPPGPMLVLSVFMSLLIFVSGIFYFRRMEKTFADII